MSSRRRFRFVLFGLVFLGMALVGLACEEQAAAPAAAAKAKKALYAVFETSMGDIECRLFDDKAPNTVANFIGLARGDQEWVDAKSLLKQKKPLYDGTIFHRVIPGFMIQGGDPKGNGTGGPGYRFPDEIDPARKFERAGLLAMANYGPDTNGSQFFITDAATPSLNGKHTIFGEVTKGQDVVAAIARTPRNANDRPVQDVVLKHVRIVERAR